jgi:hypothetical protein
MDDEVYYRLSAVEFDNFEALLRQQNVAVELWRKSTTEDLQTKLITSRTFNGRLHTDAKDNYFHLEQDDDGFRLAIVGMKDARPGSRFPIQDRIERAFPNARLIDNRSIVEWCFGYCIPLIGCLGVIGAIWAFIFFTRIGLANWFSR